MKTYIIFLFLTASTVQTIAQAQEAVKSGIVKCTMSNWITSKTEEGNTTEVIRAVFINKHYSVSNYTPLEISVDNPLVPVIARVGVSYSELGDAVNLSIDLLDERDGKGAGGGFDILPSNSRINTPYNSAMVDFKINETLVDGRTLHTIRMVCFLEPFPL